MIGVLVNGVSGRGVSAADRSIQYGDGVFETLAVSDGQPRLWLPHIKRLHRGCRRLGFSAPDTELLAEETVKLLRDSRRQAILKIVISRGCGGRGYRPPEKVLPTRLLSLHAWPEWPAEYRLRGIQARLCTTRLARNPQLAGIKHLNRLEQVLARAEWDDPAIAEGIVLDTEGLLVEGTMSNLFMVRDGVLQTPDLFHCGVAGIMREMVMEIARQQCIHCEIGRYTVRDLAEADEIFVTNSIIGIWPVRAIDAKEYRAPGEITSSLQRDINDFETSLST